MLNKNGYFGKYVSMLFGQNPDLGLCGYCESVVDNWLYQSDPTGIIQLPRCILIYKKSADGQTGRARQVYHQAYFAAVHRLR